MSVDGIQQGPTPLGPEQLGRHRPVEHTSPVRDDSSTAESTRREGPDRVEISETARRLVDQTSESGVAEAETSAVTAEQTQSILSRLRTGFYDSPEARDQIAQRIVGDLKSLTTE